MSEEMKEGVGDAGGGGRGFSISSSFPLPFYLHVSKSRYR